MYPDPGGPHTLLMKLFSTDSNAPPSWLPHAVLGAIDGCITSFVVISGAMGGQLDRKVILVLGFANLLADGLSMGVSNYHAVSGQGQLTPTSPFRAGVLTYAFFIAAGLLPLLPVIFQEQPSLLPCGILAGFVFLFIGYAQGVLIGRGPIRQALLLLGTGGGAALVAYFTGIAVDHLIGG